MNEIYTHKLERETVSHAMNNLTSEMYVNK